MLIVGVFLISNVSFADIQQSKVSKIKSLSSAFKNAQSLSAKKNQNDITMVYGGKDISLKPSIIPSTTTV